MTPARHSPLSKLVTGGHLEQVPVDSATCRELVHQASNHALTTVAAREIGDFEGAFQIAYDGCRKVCLALALAYGVRAKGDTGHHAATFNAAAAALANNVAARDLVDEATDLRFIRGRIGVPGREDHDRGGERRDRHPQRTPRRTPACHGCASGE
jgi:hypothetical protein